MVYKNRFPLLSILAASILLSACGTLQATLTPIPAAATSKTPSLTNTPTPEPELAQPADVIFHNGVILTMNASQPQAQAVAILGNKILAVGSDSDILAYQGPQTQMIDLAGQTMMPGFFDGHTHVLAFPARQGKTLDEAQEIAIRYGITSVNEMWADQTLIDTFLQKESEGALRLRVNAFPIYNEGSLDANRRSAIDQTWYPANGPILDTNRHFRIPGIKIFVDGDFTPARGCWALSEPYSPESLASVGCGTSRGDLYWLSQDQLNQVVSGAQNAGFRVAFHAMGDEAIETSLNAIAFALDGRSNDQFRHAIEHNSLIRPDEMVREAEMGVIASVRGYADLCTPGTLELQAFFGPERVGWYVNRYSLAGLGIHAFIEADFGWTSDLSDRFNPRTLDPIVQLYGMVTHKFVNNGVVCDADPSWELGTVSVEQALRMLTMEPAYAVSMETAIGSVEPGKFADLIILSSNPTTIDPNQLKDLQVWMTMINGKAEYCATGKEEFCPVGDQAVAPMPTSTTTAVQISQVKWNCNADNGSPVHISSADAVQTYIKWAAVTADQVNDFIAAVRPSILVDGVSIPSGVSHGEVSKMEGRDLFVVQSAFDVGILNPGTHEIRTTLTFDRLIADGYDSYGPGSQNVTMQGVCTVISKP